MSLNQIYSYFGDFSQFTACNAIRFGECSSTSLDKLWYAYSYIYRPTGRRQQPSIQYRIFTYFLNSQNASPSWLLTISNHASPSSLSTSLSTTSSILQLSIFLKFCYGPFLPFTLSTFFENFFLSIIFLYLAGVDNEDNYTNSNFCLINHGSVVYLYHLQILLFFNLQDDDNVYGVNDVAISDVATMTTTIQVEYYI